MAKQNCNLKPSPESYNYVFAIATIRTSKHNPYKRFNIVSMMNQYLVGMENVIDIPYPRRVYCGEVTDDFNFGFTDSPGGDAKKT